MRRADAIAEVVPAGGHVRVQLGERAPPRGGVVVEFRAQSFGGRGRRPLDEVRECRADGAGQLPRVGVGERCPRGRAEVRHRAQAVEHSTGPRARRVHVGRVLGEPLPDRGEVCRMWTPGRCEWRRGRASGLHWRGGPVCHVQ